MLLWYSRMTWTTSSVRLMSFVYKSRLGYGRMTTTVGGKPVTFEGKYVDRIPASGAHDAGIWVQR